MTKPKTPAAARSIVRANAMLRASDNADPHDAFTTLTDALCDLRHWADRHGVDYGDADHAAYRHYHAEAVEPDDLAMIELED
jgi:hypothetical protein